MNQYLIRLDCLNYFLIWYNFSRFDSIKVFYKSLFFFLFSGSHCLVPYSKFYLALISSPYAFVIHKVALEANLQLTRKAFNN